MNPERSSRDDRREYRRWVRAHHPDVGGDPDEFSAGLARRRGGDSGAEGHRHDRYDAPVEIVPDHQRLRAGLHRLWRRIHRSGPPRVR